MSFIHKYHKLLLTSGKKYLHDLIFGLDYWMVNTALKSQFNGTPIYIHQNFNLFSNNTGEEVEQ